MNFQDFPLRDSLLKAIEERGFVEPTEIQQKAIPLLCDTPMDFVGQAQTGTGKTAAFSLPLLNLIDPSNKNVQAIILSPTRELANQICEEIKKFSIHEKSKVMSVYGGVALDNQIRNLKKIKPQIVVGTPGRVLDLINRKALKLENIDFAVLDEADEMLDMGFLDDVKEILANGNEDKRTWMFSATMPRPILSLIKDYLNEPEIVKIKKKTLSNENITQKFYVVRDHNMREAVCRLLDSVEEYYGIIFTKTKIEAKNLTDELNLRDFRADSLHGDMDQRSRDITMKRFKEKKVKLLVCTDVAARGIDVDHLTHVFNYGLPQDLESYVHRIGRTGRAGNKGMALSVINPSELRRVSALEKLTKAKIEREKLPCVTTLKESMVKRSIGQFDSVYEDLEQSDEMDNSFDIFAGEFEHLDKDQVLKVMFKYIFSESMKRLDKEPSIDLEKRERRDRGERGERSSGGRGRPDSRGNVRFFVSAGKEDGITLQSLLTNVSNGLGVDERKVRNVQIKDKFSFMDIPSSFQDKLISMRSIPFGNTEVRFEPTKDRGPSRDRNRGGSRGGRSRDNFSRGNQRGGNRGSRSSSRRSGNYNSY